MSKTVVGTFPNREQAERAVNELRQQGFDQEISVVAKEEEHRQDEGALDNGQFTGGDSVGDGATTGGALGALAGLAVGAGALAIPGLGPLLAAGPLAGMLSGAATGGLAGGLIDFGIPAAESREYEEKVKQGHTLVAVQTDQSRVNQAAETLRRYEGEKVEVHG
ncbi:putative membrane protein [Desulfohalotomaculum tongense]|uniref:general stress protein n=1 Tax=Desulforadius tongensis TaxID=1216062 RepID=UPI00195AEB6F|nr:DUF1269 domain-containing protein [Desulforadius tongensis]MBM7855670.1 putative membrane protein [Desulforadius tongensis]